MINTTLKSIFHSTNAFLLICVSKRKETLSNIYSLPVIQALSPDFHVIPMSEFLEA